MFDRWTPFLLFDFHVITVFCREHMLVGMSESESNTTMQKPSRKTSMRDSKKNWRWTKTSIASRRNILDLSRTSDVLSWSVICIDKDEEDHLQKASGKYYCLHLSSDMGVINRHLVLGCANPKHNNVSSVIKITFSSYSFTQMGRTKVCFDHHQKTQKH